MTQQSHTPSPNAQLTRVRPRPGVGRSKDARAVRQSTCFGFLFGCLGVPGRRSLCVAPAGKPERKGAVGGQGHRATKHDQGLLRVVWQERERQRPQSHFGAPQYTQIGALCASDQLAKDTWLYLTKHASHDLVMPSPRVLYKAIETVSPHVTFIFRIDQPNCHPHLAGGVRGRAGNGNTMCCS